MSKDESEQLHHRVRAQALLLDALSLLDGNLNQAACYVAMALESTGLTAPAPVE